MSRIEEIKMVDLYNQFLEIEGDFYANLKEVLKTTTFINGPLVDQFKCELGTYLKAKFVVACGNGTDALQIALMALDLEKGDEVIIPSFTYVATAEVISLLGLKAILVDVDPLTFNINIENIEPCITKKTKAIIVVHLFGQAADIEPIIEFSKKNKLYVIEDNAQSLGCEYEMEIDRIKIKTGMIGDIGCTSFFPSKNLGAFGDGGAIYTNNEKLGRKMEMIANHGQSKKYYHDIVGCNSRLDSIQAAILIPKLKKIDEYNSRRQQAAKYYDCGLSHLSSIILPYRNKKSSHVFHQYTLRITNGKRDELKAYLDSIQIPNAIYYPVPLYEQKAYKAFKGNVNHLAVTEILCKEVLSLPMHTELNNEMLDYIINHVKKFLTS